jgi:hypothetical protein
MGEYSWHDAAPLTWVYGGIGICEYNEKREKRKNSSNSSDVVVLAVVVVVVIALK